jgi:glycosyltransferase involved in cell wall biosynthesis
MRIGIDIRCFSGGKNTGVEEYTKNFLQALFKNGSEHEFVLFYNVYKKTAADLMWLDQYPNVVVCHFSYPNKLLNISLWYFRYPKIDIVLEKALRGSGRSHEDSAIDVCFVPNQTFVAFSKTMPWIMTVHDLSSEHYSSAFSYKQRFWHWLVNARVMITQANQIIAVSEATCHDIIKSYGISKQCISVLLSAPTEIRPNIDRNSPAVLNTRKKYNLPRHFFLYFGTIEPRKNLITLVAAFESYCDHVSKYDDKDNVPTHLILSGTRGWKMRRVYNRVQESQYKNRIRFIYDVPSEHREALFVLAEAFVYPSHFEGFGFPPLEAILLRKCVITSHTSSLPEVVGKNGILIDPTRAEELSVALVLVAENKDLKESLSQDDAIRNHLKVFSWERSASTFLNQIIPQIARSQSEEAEPQKSSGEGRLDK